MIKDAVISECGLYRYLLTRTWEPTLPGVLWCMLNPSTADDVIDDATIRKCVGFSQQWGCGSIAVVNLFAYRSTDPAALAVAHHGGVDVVGEGNTDVIAAMSRQYDLIVAAWGVHGELLRRGNKIKSLWKQDRVHKKVVSMGLTRNGEPKHPLMLPYDAVVEPLL